MIGLATNKEEEPVILKTNIIISICQFDVIPQRSFKFAINFNKAVKIQFPIKKDWTMFSLFLYL